MILLTSLDFIPNIESKSLFVVPSASEVNLHSGKRTKSGETTVFILVLRSSSLNLK